MHLPRKDSRKLESSTSGEGLEPEFRRRTKNLSEEQKSYGTKKVWRGASRRWKSPEQHSVVVTSMNCVTQLKFLNSTCLSLLLCEMVVITAPIGIDASIQDHKTPKRLASCLGKRGVLTACISR